MYTCAAFDTLNVFVNEDSAVSIASLLGGGTVPGEYERSLRRLLEIGVEAKALTRVGTDAYRQCAPWSVLPSTADLEIMRSRFDDASDLFEFVVRLGSALPKILSGRTHAAEMLFQDGLMDIATRLYTDTPPFHYCNEIAATAVAIRTNSRPADHGLQIIEIGAGTGATTKAIIRAAQNNIERYLFTDISNFFLTSARPIFVDLPFMEYGLMNIEQRPSEEFSGKFDIAIAAHVLHATRNIGDTLRHTRGLLADDGLLVLLEETSIQPFFSVTMGMQTGFDRFDDAPLRTAHPLLSSAQWKEAVLQAGFRRYVDFPEIMGIRPILIQA